MPNVDSPNGLRPVRTIGGSPYNGSCNRYFVPSTDGTAIYLGQPVKLVGSATADGVSHVTAMTTTADVVCGVVVGVEPDTADSLLYRAASTARYLLVADDPNLLFEIQSDGVGGVAAVGEVADVTGFSGSTSTGSQPAAAHRLTSRKRPNGMSSMPAVIGSIGRSGPMKRPTSRLATP